MALTTTIGGTASDSYVTLAEYQARATAMGWNLHGSDAKEEQDLRRAAVAIDSTYSFVGIQQYQYQSRDWPRLVRDLVDDWPVNPDTIPQAVKDAQMEMAFLIQGGADPLATTNGSITMEEIGPISREYAAPKSAVARFTAVERLLRPYLAAGLGQPGMVRA